MRKTKKTDNMMDALGYEAVAWIWATHQPECSLGHDILVSICDGSHRELSRIMEEPEAHDLLNDDAMFAAFLMALAMHGDHSCWEAVNMHGYGLDSLFREPFFNKDGEFQGLYSKAERLGNWIGARCSQERIVELADDMNWAIFDIEGEKRPVIGCEWRLSGIHEDPGWVLLWKQEYTRLMHEKRREKSNESMGWQSASWERNEIPFVFFAMDEWMHRSMEKGEKEAVGRGQKRLDDMIRTWAHETYWPAATTDIWESFCENPPFIDCSKFNTDKATRTLVHIAGVVASLTRSAKSDLVAKVDNLVWMIENDRQVAAAAFIEMGAPLQEEGVDIGDTIIRQAILSRHGYIDPTLWERWVDRAKAEGSQAWERLPEFVQVMPVGKIRRKAAQDASFREMLVMALDTEAKPPARPAARF